MVQFDKIILENGLRIIVHQDTSTPIVAFNLLYNVGAKHESSFRTGFAHLFEHLMFSGTNRVPNFDTLVQKAGGESNAFTNNDYTNYYITVPYQNIELAFYLESDRMLELSFSEHKLAIQRDVVAEEFRQRYLNQPYGDVSLYMRPLAYKVHPYQWSTIGKDISHITNSQLSEVKDFFYKHYAPNNAILVVGGNVKTKEIERLAIKWFGNIPSRQIINNTIKDEPLQTEKRSLQLERNVSANALYLAYKMCSRLDSDFFASDLLSDILANGESSILKKTLSKEKQLFSDIDAYIQGSYDPGLFHINGKLYSNIDFEKAENSIKQELNSLIVGDFTARQLEKVKNRYLSSFSFLLSNNLDRCMELAYYEWLGDANLINKAESSYMSVNKADIMRVAEKIFNENQLSCIYYKSTNAQDK